MSRKFPTNDERCRAVVTHHDRITTWTLCHNRHKHEVIVVNVPKYYGDKNHVPQCVMTQVCGYHLRRLMDGNRVALHDGGWRGHFKNEPTSVDVILEKGDDE